MLTYQEKKGVCNVPARERKEDQGLWGVYLPGKEDGVCEVLTCQGKKTGVCSRGTRTGTTMTSSKMSPSMSGTTPIKTTAIKTDLEIYK